MNKIGWIIFSALTIAVFALFIVFANQSKIDVSKIDTSTYQNASSDSGNIADHYNGVKNAKVVLIEYADYQCPGCAEVYPVVKSISETYKDKILVIFRNFPLTSSHPNAKLAAAATEAAGLQNKFWEMHDKIYTGQDDWSNLTGESRIDYFVNLAKEIGIDTDKFKNDVSSKAVSQKIAFDQALANKAKVDQTPTMFLNGKKLDAEKWYEIDKFKATIEEALK